jgi:hypothetical protein
MDVKPGMRVAYHKRAGDAIFIEGKAFRLMTNRQIAVVLGGATKITQVKAAVQAS